MTESAFSPEFDLPASAAKFIKPEFKKSSSPWAGSPFEWILELPSASKGKLGKRLVYQWCALKGLSIVLQRKVAVGKLQDLVYHLV